MNKNELKEKSEQELEKLLEETRNGLRTLRFKWHAGQLTKVREIREARKTIARTLTALTNKKQA